MKTQPRSLDERRQILIEISAGQRETLAREFALWQAPLQRAARILTVLQTVRRYASWLIVGMAVLASMRRVKSATLLQRVWMILQLVRRVRHIGRFWPPASTGEPA